MERQAMTPTVDGLTPAQAARILGVTTQRVRQLTQDGRLIFMQTPLGRLLDRESVEQLRLARESRQGRAQ
jgi:excisionase family DNA binding protein